MNKQKGFTPILIIVVVLLVVVGTVYYFSKRHNVSLPQMKPPASQASSQLQKTAITKNDFFFTSIPRPIKDITVNDLPNNAFVRNVVTYNDQLWFAGSGSLIAYDAKKSQLVGYSNPKKGFCDSNVVLANNFLFTSCRMNNVAEFSKEYSGRPDYAQYAIIKLDPKTYQIKHVYLPKDGLLDTSNFVLYQDGDIVWVATSNGVAAIDATTDKVSFYIDELGIQGTVHSIGKIFVDDKYVWAYTNSNAYSTGGLSLFSKATKTWKPFGPQELKDRRPSNFDLESLANGYGFKLIPGGIQAAYRDGDITVGNETFDRLVEKQYNYNTGKWTKKSEQPATGSYYTSSIEKLSLNYPGEPNAAKEDQYKLVQLQIASKTYQLDGRNNIRLSPVIEEKRYLLTSGTIDVIDDTYPFRQILVKLHDKLETNLNSDYTSVYNGPIQFLVDPETLQAFVASLQCGPGMDACSPSQKVWLIDLKNAKILKEYTAADKVPIVDNLTGISLTKEGTVSTIHDSSGKTLFSINTANYNFIPSK